MKEETLTDQQIGNWRRVMAIQGLGTFAFLCPKEMVIDYWKRMKQIVESASEVQQAREEEQFSKPVTMKRSKPKKCPPHGNTITGGRGTYCLDCENYI